MAAGTAYSKRYAGGFVDGSGGGTPIDSVALNAIETALLQLIGAAPTADGQVAQWDNANTRFGPALILNKNVDPAAAIAKSKLDLTGANGIVNADIAAAAAIARSKLDFGSGLVNADIASAAAIALSKLASIPSYVPYRKTTAKAVNTTVAATDLLNGEITISAGLLATTGALRLTCIGDWLQNSGGAAAPPRFQLKLGATTLIDTGAGGNTSATATRMPWHLVIEIHNLTASSQVISLEGTVMSLTPTAGAAAFTTGEGQILTIANGLTYYSGVNTTAVDTTGALALVLNVINGSASASYETKLLAGNVELLS